MNPEQFRRLIIKPVLLHLGLYSKAAENLLIGTATQESRLSYLQQMGGGPALGVYQIEPATHNDLWNSYLIYRPEFHHLVSDYKNRIEIDDESELIGNLFYATAICRLIYYRKPYPLPEADDIWGLANYWKKHYNTIKGKGRVEEFYNNYPIERK